MKLRPRLGIAVAVLFVAAMGLATYLAGERTEVAVLATVDANGNPQATKLWVVDHDGRPWVRVGRPGRSWLRNLSAQPRVTLERGGVTKPYVATAVRDPATRAAVDQAFADKYGLTDWWYGLVLRSDPTPVRLDPIDEP
jgi:hypothetical protein